MGRVGTEGAWSQRDPEGGAASTEGREAESGRSAGGVGAHRHPGLVTDEGGRGRRRRAADTEGRGEEDGERPRWLSVQSVTVPHLMNGWVSHYSQLFSPFCHKKRKRRRKIPFAWGN